MAAKKGNKAKKKVKRRKRGSVDCKAVLMDSVVHLTSEHGIEGLSTRLIANTAPGVSGDAYIYTIFGSKENLMFEAFLREDAKFAEVFLQSSSVLSENGISFESRLRNLWHPVWSWLTVYNPEICLFLTRYSCSSLFDEETAQKHRELWQPVAEILHDLFPNADSDKLTETVGLLLLNTASKAILDNTANNSVASENGFWMLAGLFGYWHKGEDKAG